MTRGRGSGGQVTVLAVSNEKKKEKTQWKAGILITVWVKRVLRETELKVALA